MCDSIANGGPRCAPSCPPANVTIASNVLSTTGDIYASNGTFTGTLTVTGNIVGPVNLTNLYVANSVTTTNVFFQNRILSTNLPVFNTAQGTWGSSANVSQVTVDQYGRVSTAANVAITSSQWTSVAGNVAFQNGVSIGTLSAPPTGSNLLVLGTATISNINSNGSGLSSLNAANLSGPATLTNLYVANSVTTTNVTAGGTLGVTGAMTSNVANTTFFYDTFTIPYINTQVLNAASIVFTSANLATLNVSTTANIGTLNATSVISINPISFRNRIINGDFLIDQRNSGASSTPTTDTKVIDRWKVNIAGSGRCLVGQNLGTIASPTGLTSYFGMKVTTTSTVNAGDYWFFSQVIEGINAVDFAWGTASARPVTLGFWVYSSLTGTMGGFVRNAGATAGNYSRSYPFTFSISSAATWEYKTVTILGDTIGQWISGQVDGIEVGFELWNGANFQGPPGAWGGTNYTGPSGGTAAFAGTLNSYMYLTGVQVELGSVATPFERRHINLELGMCQRYYESTIARLGGYNTTGGALRSSVYFNTKKRPAATPTFTVISAVETPVNMGTVNIDNSNFDQSSARILAAVTATGDAYGQWKVSVDCEF